MANSTANRQAIAPEVRRAVEEKLVAVEALTFSADPSQAEVEALQDAVVSALRTVFGKVS